MWLDFNGYKHCGFAFFSVSVCVFARKCYTIIIVSVGEHTLKHCVFYCKLPQ